MDDKKDLQKDLKLERKLNPLNVWALALGSIIGWAMDFLDLPTA